jgi:hypothetical protein
MDANNGVEQHLGGAAMMPSMLWANVHDSDGDAGRSERAATLTESPLTVGRKRYPVPGMPDPSRPPEKTERSITGSEAHARVDGTRVRLVR